MKWISLDPWSANPIFNLFLSDPRIIDLIYHDALPSHSTDKCRRKMRVCSLLQKRQFNPASPFSRFTSESILLLRPHFIVAKTFFFFFFFRVSGYFFSGKAAAATRSFWIIFGRVAHGDRRRKRLKWPPLLRGFMLSGSSRRYYPGLLCSPVVVPWFVVETRKLFVLSMRLFS